MFEMTPDFILGFLSGFVIAVLIIYVISMIYGYWNRMQRPFKPQTITHRTEKTPREVIDDARSASYALFMTLAMVVLIIVVVAGLLFPDLINVVSAWLGI